MTDMSSGREQVQTLKRDSYEIEMARSIVKYWKEVGKVAHIRVYKRINSVRREAVYSVVSNLVGGVPEGSHILMDAYRGATGYVLVYDSITD